MVRCERCGRQLQLRHCAVRVKWDDYLNCLSCFNEGDKLKKNPRSSKDMLVKMPDSSPAASSKDKLVKIPHSSPAASKDQLRGQRFLVTKAKDKLRNELVKISSPTASSSPAASKGDPVKRPPPAASNGYFEVVVVDDDLSLIHI